jgi:hypothetical protein
MNEHRPPSLRTTSVTVVAVEAIVLLVLWLAGAYFSS